MLPHLQRHPLQPLLQVVVPDLRLPRILRRWVIR